MAAVMRSCLRAFATVAPKAPLKDAAKGHSLRKQTIKNRAEKILLQNRMLAFFERLDCNSNEWLDLKSEMAKHNLKLTVLPNRISKHVLTGTKYEALNVMFTSTMAVVYGNEPAWPAVLNLAKHPKMVFAGARLDDMLLGQSDVRKIMALPDIDTLRAHLLQTMLAPVYETSRLLSANTARLSQLLTTHTAPAPPADKS